MQFSSQITDVLRMDLARGLICRWFVLVLTMMLVGGLHPLAANAQVVTTVAGDGTYGFADGTGTAAQFKYPTGVAVQGDSLFVADGSNDRIRMIILSTREVTTVAGGTEGFLDGTGTAARFNFPAGVAVQGDSLFVADLFNHRIRKIILSTQEVTTVAGGTEGFLDGTGTAARFDHPRGVAVQGDSLFVADRDNNRIRKIILSTQEVTTVAGDGTEGFLDGTGTAARFDDPRGVAVQGDILFVADRDNNRIRKIILSTQEVTTVAGGTKGFLDGTGTTARFNYPYGVAVQGGSLFVADAYNNRIRKIILSTQEVTTVAGGTEGFLDGTGTAARLDRPRGLLVRGDILFVADTDNYRIRKIVLKPIIVTSSLLTFGNVPLADGVTTVTDTIKIKNTGAQPLTVSAVNVSGLDAASYAVVSPASFTVSGGDSANLAVAFSPSAPGRSDASLVLTHNDVDAGSQTTITLHANVYERIPGYVIAWGEGAGNVDLNMVLPADLTHVIAIEAGVAHGLALKLDGTVVGWGGLGPIIAGQADVPVGLSDVVAIAGGFFHSLALKADGTVVAWGSNGSGETDVPVELNRPVAIAGGLFYSLALRSDGTVVAWGVNSNGQTDVPVDLTDVIAISGSIGHSLALRVDGTVVAWGENSAGETDVPAGLTDVTAVAAGVDYSLALKSDGTVVAWGDNTSETTNVPVDLTDVTAITAAWGHSNALRSDGTVVAWGDEYLPPNANAGNMDVPADLKHVLAISSVDGYNLALREPTPSIITPSLLTFGDVPLPDGVATVTDSIKISNTGTAALTVIAVTVSGLDADSYAVVSPVTFTIPAGDSTNLGVAFSPSALGRSDASLVLTHNDADAGSQTTIALHANVYERIPGYVIAWGIDVGGSMEVPAYLTDVIAIESGLSHGLALRSDGTVVGWGGDFPTNEGQGVIPVGLSDVVAIAGGIAHSLALKADGTVVAWGSNFNGGTDVPSDLINPVAIAGGAYFSLALKSDGTVIAWGDNSDGQTDVPADLTDVTAISAGSNFSLALKSDGTVIAWGKNNSGQTDVPVDLADVIALSGGQQHSLALKSDGTVVAWGSNNAGQTDVPVDLTNVISVGGAYSSLALKSDGTVVAWGAGSGTDVPADLKHVFAIAVGNAHSIALREPTPSIASSLLNFGDVPLANGVDTVTDTIKIKNTGTAPLTVSAVNVSGLDPGSYAVVSPTSFTVSGGDSANLAVAFSPSAPGRSDASLVLTHNDVDAGSQTTIALHANVYERIPGYVIAWGTNNWGATVVPADLTGVIAIESGYVHGLALKLDGTVVGWGAVPNDWDSGQADIPVGLTDVVTIAGGFFHSLALKADGTVVAWGDNSDGQTDVPVDLINPVAIAGGLDYSLALRSDGTVVAWGDGMGATNVPAYLTDVIAISSFVEHVLALKSDGTVVAWGSNDYGELDVPVDLTDVIAVSAGYEHSLALKSDGTVEAWGRNDYGQTTVPGDLTDVIAVGGGNSHSLALKSDGTVVSWGDSSYGQAVVPADWTYGLAISVGFHHNLALIDPRPTIATSSLFTFGDVPLANGVASVTDTIKIKNKGTLPLTVSAVNVSGVDGGSYSVVSPTSFTVSGGDSTKLAVAFLPSVPGRSDASLVLTHNDADAGSQTTITLHANVYERIPGDVIAWGANRSGVAEIPNDLTDVIAIESGLEHSLALKLDGTVVGWGGGASAEIPVGLTDVVAIAGGFFSSLALKADGTVVAWGNNGWGETDVPVDLINPVAIAGGMLHSLALRSDGTVVGWGFAAYADVPANLTDVIAISSFFTHSLALKSDGTVVAWGDSVSGQTVVPVDLTDVIAVSAGYEHSLALKSDGTVVAWGENSSGQTDVPVDLTNVISVGGGDGHSLALKSDGTVVAWGSNFNGETDVPADLTDAVAIAAGYDHSLALRAAWAAVGDTVVSYGNVNVGDSVRRSLKITNKGSFPLVVSAVSVVGPDSASFSATPTAFSVAGRDSFDLSVTFAPSSTGMKSAALSIAHNATGSPSLVALTGTGGQSSIELSTAALSLGSVPLGSSSTEYITVRNTGAGQLSVSSIGVLDGDFALFKVTPAVLPNVSAGDSAYVRVDFTPVTTGDFSTTLTLTHNASGSPSAIILSGKGTKPAIDISSGLVSLGPVPIGSSAFDSLKVKNRGSAQLVVSGIGVSGGDADLFTVTPSTLILAAGDSAYLRIAFTPVTVRETIVGVDPGPVALGDFSTTLSLTHNAGGLVNVSLSGLSWTTWRLFNARPNPFNVSVSMAYEIPVQTHVTLTVYNTLGQEVVRIVDQVLIPGRYEAVWDGINARGIRVSAGIYLYRIKCASGYTATKKMVFLK